MTITALISAAGHTVVVGFYEYPLTLPRPGPQQTSQLVMVPRLVE